MIEQEAELGSDNEENDHIRKNINRQDSEENDDDDELDHDLEELINNDKENGDEMNAMNKYYDDLKKQDKEAFKNAYLVAMGEGKKNWESDSLAQERLKISEELRLKQLERDRELYGDIEAERWFKLYQINEDDDSEIQRM